MFNLACAVAFWPILRRDATTRLWAVTMLLAAVPAATVVPLSKNLDFVAVGAFGVIASFLSNLTAQDKKLPLRAVSWYAAIYLIAAHVAGSLACRVGLAAGCRFVPEIVATASDYEPSLKIAGKDVVILNDPGGSTIMAAFYRAYSGEPMPESSSIMVPGSVPIQVDRPDAFTLVLTAREGDLFGCRPLGPMHLAYACKAANELIFSRPKWIAGEHVQTAIFDAETLHTNNRGAPTSISFRFHKPLESDSFLWLYFDWSHLTHGIFLLPKVGQTAEIAGPKGNLKAKSMGGIAAWTRQSWSYLATMILVITLRQAWLQLRLAHKPPPRDCFQV